MNQPKEFPILAIDTRNLCFVIASRQGPNPTAEQFQKMCLDLTYLNSRAWLIHPLPIRVVWLRDSAPYWRELYEPEYKANRSRSELHPLVDRLDHYVKQNFETYVKYQFEADDLAGNLLRAIDGKAHLFLLSTDSDWGGLVGPNCTQLNPAFSPHIRGEVEIYEWAFSRYKKASKFKRDSYTLPSILHFTCRQVWEWKTIDGDSSDNLPPGTDIRLFDLIDPLVRPPALNFEDVQCYSAFEYDPEYLIRMAQVGICPIDNMKVKF